MGDPSCLIAGKVQGVESSGFRATALGFRV